MANDAAVQTQRRVTLVDADIHPTVSSAEISEYVPEPWRTRYFMKHVSETMGGAAQIYIPPPSGNRRDATPPRGGPAGSDPAFVDKQLFQDMGIDFAVVIMLFPRPKLTDPQMEMALCVAHNNWLAETWLGRYNWHGRYRGSIRVCMEDPEAAAREIERWAGHPYVVQVNVFPESAAPYGQQRFHPILEASARTGIPIAMHVIRQPAVRMLSPVGFPSYTMETFPERPLHFMAHLASFVFEGVFEKFPDLRVACVEGGFTWLAPLLWRFDRQWKTLGGSVPEVRRPPSEYIREHVRLTTQPVEEPSDALFRLMEWMHAEELVMFSTDYPHYDADDPAWITPRLPARQRDRILFENAVEFYGLPRTRPMDDLDRSVSRQGSMAPPPRLPSSRHLDHRADDA